MGKHQIVVLLLVALAVSAAPAQQQKKKPPLTATRTVGWENCYYPLEWTPIDVTITSNLKEPFAGVVSVETQQDELTRVTTRQPVAIAPLATAHTAMVVKMTGGGESARLRVAGENGKQYISDEFGGYNYSGGANLTTLNDRDVLIGFVGTARHLRQLEGNVTDGHNMANVYVRRKDPRHLPWDWTGYSSLRLLVLHDADLAGIHREQAQAIREFVLAGGRLLIVLGSNPLPADGPIASLLPFKPGSPREQTLQLQGVSNQATAVWQLPEDARLPAMWQAVRSADSTVGAAGPAGFGRVGVLAFNPDTVAQATRQPSPRLWLGLLNGMEMLQTPLEAGEAMDLPDWQVDHGAVQSNTNEVLGQLLDIPELEPLSIWWVIGLLAGLALLLGPIDYLVLKKLDQLPRTWMTSAAVIGVFTIGAYYGVAAIRGGQLQLQAISVVDAIQDGPAFNTTYAGLFASGSDRYELEGLGSREWWSSVSPQQTETYYSGGPSTIGRSLSCQQRDGRCLPDPLPVNIWTMQCLLRETPTSTLPFRAEVHVGPGNQPRLTLDGEEMKIDQVRVTHLGRLYTYSGVEAGQAISPVGQAHHDLNDFNSIVDSRGCRNRTVGLEPYRTHPDYAIVHILWRPELGFTVADKVTQVNHRQLIRLVVPVTREQS
jgi:hypothetical protein